MKILLVCTELVVAARPYLVLTNCMIDDYLADRRTARVSVQHNLPRTRSSSSAAGLSTSMSDIDHPTTAIGLLTQLTPELLQHILTFLDVADLLAVSRTCKQLRLYACDPTLHRGRRQRNVMQLSSALTTRPQRSDLLGLAHQQQGHGGRNPLISLVPAALLPNAYLYSPQAAVQIQAFFSVSKLLRAHRLRKAIERRPASARHLTDRGWLDAELKARGGDTRPVAYSLVPAMRALKKAQKADVLRRSMRLETARRGDKQDSPGSWKTAVDVFEMARGVWREHDPRVVSAMVRPPPVIQGEADVFCAVPVDPVAHPIL